MFAFNCIPWLCDCCSAGDLVSFTDILVSNYLWPAWRSNKVTICAVLSVQGVPFYFSKTRLDSLSLYAANVAIDRLNFVCRSYPKVCTETYWDQLYGSCRHWFVHRCFRVVGIEVPIKDFNGEFHQSCMINLSKSTHLVHIGNYSVQLQ